MSFIVYKCTNLINGKLYIGYSSKSLKTRIASHYSKARKTNSAFLNALKKYEKSDFKWEILETFNTTAEALKKERFYIKELNTRIPNGYNMSAGGEGSTDIKHTKDTAKAISERMKIAVKDPNSNIYKNLQRQKIKVIRNDGKIYESLSDAARDINSSPENMHCHIFGKTNHVKGYTFNTEDENIESIKIATLKKRESAGKKRIIDQYGTIYKSLTSAAKILNLQIGNISKVLGKDRNHTGGYIFTFYEEKNEECSNKIT